MKLISLNIHEGKHIPSQLILFNKEKPDLLCLQEVRQDDYVTLRKALGMDGFFLPTWVKPDGSTLGLAMLTRLIANWYRINEYAASRAANGFGRTIRQFVVASLGESGQYVVGNIHFTWSPDGRATQQQRDDLQGLLLSLERYQNMILCGDFNAPRGGEIFSVLGAKYKDNIPKHYTTSIDPDIHRAGALDLMVDGLFSTMQYEVRDVQLVPGVSDHYAVCASIGINNLEQKV